MARNTFRLAARGLGDRDECCSILHSFALTRCTALLVKA